MGDCEHSIMWLTLPSASPTHREPQLAWLSKRPGRSMQAEGLAELKASLEQVGPRPSCHPTERAPAPSKRRLRQIMQGATVWEPGPYWGWQHPELHGGAEVDNGAQHPG